MFHTFAVAETTWNNGVGRPILTQDTAMNIYSFFTVKDLLNDLQTAKASPDLVAALNQRVSGGIHVPRDFATLEEAVGVFERYADSDSISFSMIKDSADAEHKANDDPDIVTIPRKIVVGEGKHKIKKRYLNINSTMNIVGDPEVPKEEIVVVGGIWFKKGIPGNCHLQHLTVRRAKGMGVKANSSFTMEDVLVEQCGSYGVVADGTGVVGRCTNVEVRHCVLSGVLANMDASITLIGAKTTVHHNCTKGRSVDYGLVGGEGSIQLVSPLTIGQVSKDNGGGGNFDISREVWTFRHISQEVFLTLVNRENLAIKARELRAKEKAIKAAKEKAIKAAKAALEKAAREKAEKAMAVLMTVGVRVPEDCKSLEEAVKRVEHDSKITTIVLGKGEHRIRNTGEGVNYLEIFSAIKIVGDPRVAKEYIQVVGGIIFNSGIPGNCHLQHLTLSHSEGNGVYGSSSFTMEDVLVKQCSGDGVMAMYPGVVGRCTNVEVRQCGRSGVLARDGASITLVGAKTKVHHNCTAESSFNYGLKVSSSSTIQLVSPLTKEQVSTKNGTSYWQRNWGAVDGGDINQIKTIVE